MIWISLNKNKQRKLDQLNTLGMKKCSGFKDKVISLFKTNAPKQTVYER